MLEPVKRTNFESYKIRVDNKLRFLSLNQKVKEGSAYPLSTLENQSQPQSPFKINDEGAITYQQKLLNKNTTPKPIIQSQDLSRINSNQTNKSNPNSVIQNTKKTTDFLTPTQSTIFSGIHRKSLSTLTLTIGSAKGQNKQKLNDYLQSQNSPLPSKNNHNSNQKNLFFTDSQFFNSKHYSIHNNNLSQGSEVPLFAFGNTSQGFPSDFQSKYLNVPKTAGIGIRDHSSQTPSKVTQAYLDQYQDKAQLLDQAENKVYSIFDSKSRSDSQYLTLTTSSYLTNAFQTQRGESTAAKVTQIDSFHPHTLSTNQPETFFFSSHNFYYFVINVKTKQSPLKLTVKIKNPPDGYQNKLKGFISKTANRPNTFNSDDEFDGRSYKMYAEGGKKIFSFDTVYLSLYPELDMTASITISFGESKIQMNEAYVLYKKQKQKTQEEQNMNILQQIREREQKVYDSMNQQNMKKSGIFDFTSYNSSPAQSSMNLVINKSQIQSSKQRRLLLQSCEGVKRRNITQHNKFNMPNMFDKYEKLLKQKEGNEAKLMEVQQRKNQILQEKVSDVEEKFKISSLRSQFQIEKKKLVEKISKFQLWQLVWLKFIKQIIVLKAFHDKVKVMIKRKQVCHQAKYIAIRAIANWMIGLRKIGTYPEKRALSLSRIATNRFASMIQQKCKAKAESMISTYLQQSSKISDLKTKGILFMSRVLNIQKQWRETKQKKKRFKELIVRQFQAKYSDLLYEIRLDARKLKDPFYQPKNNSQATNVKITDYVLLSQIVQNYLMQHLRKYYDLYDSYRSAMRMLHQMSIENKKNYSISVAMRKPVFFRLPKDSQLKQMVKEYAELKQLII